MKKSLCFGKDGLVICLSWLIHQNKPIRRKHHSLPKSHKPKNLVLIAEAEKRIRRNSGVISVDTFLHADFEGVEFIPQGDMCI